MRQRGRLGLERIRAEGRELLPVESMEELERLLKEHA